MEQQRAYLDLTIISASDLKRGWLSGDQTVAIAWIDPLSKKSTGVTSGGGCNAQWHEKLTVPLSDADAIARHGKWLTIEIRSQGALGGDNLLGTTNVPLAELALDTQKEANSTQTYQLVLPSGKRYGSVSFLGKIVKPKTSGSLATFPSAPPASLLHAYDTGSQSNVFYPHVSYPSDEIYNHRDNTSCGLASYPPQVYPPVNASYPSQNPLTSCVSCSYVGGVAPYPPQFSSAPYPPPTSMYQYTTPPVSYPPIFVYPLTAPHHSETPYPPPPFYPYPTHSGPLYPPPYPPYGPHPAF